MKFFVKILIPSLFLSLSASAHDTVNDEPFIRCFKKKEPNVDVVAFYAYAEGIAGMVVKGEKYVIDERLKNRGYPLAEGKLVKKDHDGVETVQFHFKDQWSLLVQFYQKKSWDTILNYHDERIVLKCVFWQRN